jgi:hypothetical protein
MSHISIKSVVIGLIFFGTGFFFLFHLGYSPEPSEDVPSNPATLVYQSLKGLIVGVGLMVVGAMFMARSIINIIIQPFMGMLFPDETYVPPALYSLPEMYLRQDRAADAAAEYEKILKHHPDEANAHIFLIEVALTRLKDPHRAEKTHRHGMRKIKDETQRKLMTDWYEALKQGSPGQLPQPGTDAPPPSEEA